MKKVFIAALCIAVIVACKQKKQITETAAPTNKTTEQVATAPVQEEAPKKEEKIVTPAVSETVNWMTLEEAIAAQKTEARPIMMDVYTQWCGPCKMLSKNTFGDARVAQFLNTHYYAVKFDAESADTVRYGGITFANPDFVPNQPGRNSPHQFSQYLRVTAYPTLFFFDKAGQPVGPLTGYRTPAQIEIYLHYFKDELYKVHKTQEDFGNYEKNFQVTWN